MTNGVRTVGPIDTSLLLRGYVSGRIPADCQVGQPGWKQWRLIGNTREVRALELSSQVTAEAGRFAADSARSFALQSALPESFFSSAKTVSDLGLLALHLAVKQTGANVALLHRRREPFVGLVSCTAHGDVAHEQLGQVLLHRDPAVLAAERGDVMISDRHSSEAARSTTRRLSESPLAGVAMVPIRSGSRLLGMIELGKYRHRFRSTDAHLLSELSDATTARLSSLAAS